VKKNLLIIIGLILFFEYSYSQLNVDYYLNQGRWQLSKDKYKEAIVYFNMAIDIKPTNPDSYFLRGVAKDYLLDYIGSEQDYSKAIQLKSNFTYAYYYRGVARVNLKKHYLAINDFTEAIELNSIEPDFYTFRGFCKINIEQYEQAIDDFNKSIYLLKKNKKAFNYRGLARLMNTDTTGAIADYNKAIEIDPSFHYAYLNKGFLYYEQQLYDTAIFYFSKVAAIDPLNTTAYINRALSYHNKKNIPFAIADLDTAIHIDPNNSIALFNRALMKSDIGLNNEAILDLDKVIKLNPENVLCYFNRGAIKSETGDLQGAFIDYSYAIDIYPDFAKAYINRSVIRQKLNDLKGAYADREKAEKIIASINTARKQNTNYADTSVNLQSFITFKSSNRFFNQSEKSLHIEPENNFSFLPGQKNNEYFIKITHTNDQLFAIKNDFENLGIVLSKEIENYQNDDYYTARINEFSKNNSIEVKIGTSIYKSIIKNYNDAINDLTAVITTDTTNFIAYFSRANIRFEMINYIKQLENQHNIYLTGTEFNAVKKDIIESTENFADYELVLEDLQKAKKLSPHFIFCDYNLGNTYLQMRDYRKAIEHYNLVIKSDKEFKEAYYNRGLTYIYLKESENGCMDMSKAGELGMEEAYEVIGRFCDK
jgi:tetratricopeptide (TPR) repeat protein